MVRGASPARAGALCAALVLAAWAGTAAVAGAPAGGQGAPGAGGVPSAALVAAPAPPSPVHPATYTDNQPGRVEQLPGQAGYSLGAPLGTTMTTTVTTPTLTCAAVPAADRGVQSGVQLTFELAGQYLMEQSTCLEGQQYNQYNVTLSGLPYTRDGLEGDQPGSTATFTETVYATHVAANMDVPAQSGTRALNQTWTIGGSFSSGGGFIGLLDYVYGGTGGVPPYGTIPYANTQAGGEALGAYIQANPSAHAAEQNSVFHGTLQGQTSYVGATSSFTIGYVQLALPEATMDNPSVFMPATGTNAVDVTVSLSAPSAYPVYISYDTGGGTAVPNGNYDTASGTLTFTPGVTTQKIALTILPGEGGSTNITFDVYLSNPSYATTQPNPAKVTIDTVGVTGVSPNAGLVQGGNQVVLRGHGFTDATSVLFTPLGGTPVSTSDFTVSSDTQMTVTAPDLTAQLGAGQSSILADIQVVADPAESSRHSADTYTAVELSVGSVHPDSGPLAGGTAVTISGSGFTWATDVRFTLSNGSQYTVPVTPVVGTSLTVASPAVPGNAVKAGKVVANVQVEDDDQGVEAASPETSADLFTYQGPVVSSVQPQNSPLAGHSGITVDGSDFTDATAVVFAFANGTKTTVKAAPTSSGSISVAAPAVPASLLATDQAVANVEVRVTTDGSSATSPANPTDTFTFRGPSVTGLSQTTGPLAGGTTVAVSGTGFTGATGVVFHFANGSSIVVPASASSNTAVTVVSPAVPATDLSTGTAIADVEVQVAAGAGTTATSPATPADHFTFQGPSVSGVIPASGAAQGKTPLTLSGHGFTAATHVLFHFADGSSLSVPATALADTSLQVTTPEITASVLANDQAVSDVEVQVAAAGGTTATSPATPSDRFTYQGPAVTKLSVTSGPVQGGTTVKVTGSNLSGASAVVFVAADGSRYTAAAKTVTASSVTAVTPALPASELRSNVAVVHLEVEVPLADGSLAISPGAKGSTFTMHGPAVHKVSPATGLEGTVVTVSGADLTGADEVTFTVAGVAYPATPTKVSATSLSVVTPTIAPSAMASGLAKATVQVDVPLPGPSTAVSPATKADVFSYQAPAVTSVAPLTGPVAGGTKVTVKGKNLAKATTVTLTIGSTVLSVSPLTKAATSLTFAAPPVPAGLVGAVGAKATVQVDVPAPSGVTLVSAANVKSHYTYRGPTVTKISPTSGPSTGGTVVTVTGTQLTDANEVLVTVGTTVFTVTPTKATATVVTFKAPAIPSSLLHNGKAVAAVVVGVPGAGGSEAKSPVGKAAHYTYLTAP